jgi:O-antigen/teichoic acid export membrane protein
LFGIVLARLLVPGDFGLLVTIQVFTGLAGFISGGGMGQALVRAKAASRQDYAIVFTLQIIMGSLIYAMFFFAAPWIARWYGTPIYVDLLRVSALSFIFRPFVNLPGSILVRNMRYKALSLAGLASLAASSVVSITLAYLGYGVWSLILSGIAGSLVNMALLIPLSKWRPTFSLDIRRGRDIARYGLLVSITDILGYLRNQASVFILSRTLGPQTVGLYNKGESLARIPHAFITGSVYEVLFRAMSAEQDNLDTCRYLFLRSVALVAVYATPFYVGLLFLSEPLIRGLYGEKWLPSAIPLSILAFAWPFWLMDNLSGAVLAAQNWLHREVFVQTSTIIISCLALIIGLTHGLTGTAYAVLCVAAYNAIYMLWLAMQSLKARFSALLLALLPATMLNLVLACALFISKAVLPSSIHKLDLLYVLVMAGVGALVYTVCFLYLPIAALQTEQQRWKIRLHLSRATPL